MFDIFIVVDKNRTVKLEDFLKQKEMFKLGMLPTEQSHPDTKTLSQDCQTDPVKALESIRKVDLMALDKLSGSFGAIKEVRELVAKVLRGGGRIFIGGCGSTGRLALTIECLWRQLHQGKAPTMQRKIVSFMAGGDVALVASLEKFEDHAEFGARQLRELGFQKKDLFIGVTEGGETPFVIGATLEGAALSQWPALFLHTNPSDLLIKHVDRSREVLTHPKVKAYDFVVGPQALSGSTRLQSSTALMLALGLVLFFEQNQKEQFEIWQQFVETLDQESLVPFILKESETYQSGDRTLYCSRDFGISVFTDTTERAPTFSLLPFDHQSAPRAPHSLTYMVALETRTSLGAWKKFLGRLPRLLNWPEVNPKTSPGYLEGYDFSKKALDFRFKILPDCQHHLFKINKVGHDLQWSFRDVEKTIPCFQGHPLFQHLSLKILLNAHSTVTMGRLGRFEGNLMTWVTPTNGKLIDRSVRYCEELLRSKNKPIPPYEELVTKIFAELDAGKPNQSIVMNVVGSY